MSAAVVDFLVSCCMCAIVNCCCTVQGGPKMAHVFIRRSLVKFDFHILKILTFMLAGSFVIVLL